LNLAATQLLRHRFWAAELLICGPQLRYCQPATDFGLRAPPRQLCYCEQPELNFATTFALPSYKNTANLLLSGAKVVRYETTFSLKEF